MAEFVPGRQAWFHSSSFPPLPGEEGSINPGVHGFRLAEFLSQELRRRGISAGDPWSDDWGWGVSVAGQPFRVTVCCASVGPEEFSCSLEPATAKVRHWFRKYATAPAIEPVLASLRDILTSHPEIRNLRWE